MTPPAKPKAPTVPRGYIPPAGVFTARAFCAEIGWCRTAYRQAKRRGLTVVRFGNKEYIRAEDAGRFFTELAEGKSA